MLQYVGAKLSQKMSILIVNLNLMRGRPLCHNNFACLLYNAHSIRVEKLTFAFATFAKFKLKSTLLVEYLYAMRIGVGDDNVVLSVNGDATRLRKLTFCYAELTKFTFFKYFSK
jgi:hypothetical protein